MGNLFESAKTIQEKRDILKGLSKPLQILVKSDVLDSVNEGLKAIYSESGHTDLKTLHQWNKEGKSIKKGERALCLWGSPKRLESAEDSHNSTTDQTDENDSMNFYPLCFVFSNLQVYEKEA